jgi:N-acetylmuramoyl-L-alanine amidase
MGGVGRWRRRIAVMAALAALAIARSPAAFAKRPSAIKSVRADRQGDIIEVRLTMTGRPHLRVSRRGNELRLDFEGTRLEIPSRPLFGKEAPPLSALRAMDEGGGNARIVLKVDGETDYALARIGHEVIIRIAPAGKVPDLADALLADAERIEAPERGRRTHPPSKMRRPQSQHEARTSPPATGVVPPSSRDHVRLSGHALVVIDPGHGGRDPGTEAFGGRLTEKDLALAISRRLKTALEARGVTAKLTRDADVYLTLPQRTIIANNANADLFASIHLNSSSNTQTTGIEVYYLNNTTDRATIRLARMENAGTGAYGARAGANLNYILADMLQNYKAVESAALARTIETDTVAELDDTFGLGVRPLGAKMGPFYVLVGARMPAVLVECGFLSNPVEAQRLATPAYQDRLADGIASAIVRYLNADLAVGNL